MGPSLASLLSQKANPGELGQTLGLNQSFGSLARVAGPTLGGFLYGLDFHLPYVFGAAILMFSLLLALTIFKERVS